MGRASFHPWRDPAQTRTSFSSRRSATILFNRRLRLRRPLQLGGRLWNRTNTTNSFYSHPPTILMTSWPSTLTSTPWLTTWLNVRPRLIRCAIWMMTAITETTRTFNGLYETVTGPSLMFFAHYTAQIISSYWLFVSLAVVSLQFLEYRWFVTPGKHCPLEDALIIAS